MYFKFEKDESLINIVNKLPENEVVAREILDMLGNKTTKIEKEPSIHDSFYVDLKDTIYLADNERNNKGISRICLIAHECKHSVQSKILQKLNFILSNLELIAFIVFVVLMFIYNSKILLFSYLAFSLISFIPRCILEVNAVFSSSKIAKEYLETKVTKEEAEKLSNVYKKSTRGFMFGLFILNLLYGKIVRGIILTLIYIF